MLTYTIPITLMAWLMSRVSVWSLVAETIIWMRLDLAGASAVVAFLFPLGHTYYGQINTMHVIPLVFPAGHSNQPKRVPFVRRCKKDNAALEAARRLAASWH